MSSTTAYEQNSADRSVTVPELLRALARARLTIAAFVIVGLAAGGAWVLFATPWFQAGVLAAPASDMEGGGALAGLGSELGGIAGLIGLDLGSTSNKEEAIATLRSRALIREFISDRDLMPVLFESDWDADTAQWKTADAPTLEAGVTYFSEKVLRVGEDRRSGLVTVSVTWTDRERAAEWANALVERANGTLRARAISESEKSLSYLQREVENAEAFELRQALFRAIESNIKRIALARSRSDFAFRVIDPAVAPDADDPVSPRPVIALLLGAVLGGLFGLVVAGLRR